MTPLSFAQNCIADLARTYPLLPAPPSHAQMGDLVVDCAGLYATVLNRTQYEIGGPRCGFITLADITVVAARDCANVSKDDGTTDWAAQDAVSAQMDLDGDMLWEWAEKQQADAFAPVTPPSITWMITGGVALTTLMVQLPVP
jgi:hypothetical protein